MMNKKKQPFHKQDILLEGLDLVRTVLVCLVVVSVFVYFFYRPVQVDGRSMDPTLKNGEIGLSNVFRRLTSDIKRFDIVVVKEPRTNDLWVKRVIGLPGETIKYQNGLLYINGKHVEEPFLDKSFMVKQSGSFENFTKDFNVDGFLEPLKEHEYFLVGDNRNNSYDSRARGAFLEDEIQSIGVFVLYPFDQFGSK